MKSKEPEERGKRPRIRRSEIDSGYDQVIWG